MQNTWVATCKSLSELEFLIKAKLERVTDTHLTITQAYVLQALYTVDGRQPSELAKYTGREATSFTPVLDAMEREGLIERHEHKRDRRGVLIHLTASKGLSLAQAVSEALTEVEAEYVK